MNLVLKTTTNIELTVKILKNTKLKGHLCMILLFLEIQLRKIPNINLLYLQMLLFSPEVIEINNTIILNLQIIN